MSATGETVLTSDARENPKVVAIRSCHLHRLRLQLLPLPLQLLPLPITLRSSPSASTAVDTKTMIGTRFLASHHLPKAVTMSDHAITSTAMPIVGGTQHPKKLLWTPTKNTDGVCSRKQSALAATLVTRIATLTARRNEEGRRMSVTGLEALKTARVRLHPGIAL
jgi:hypothetical protein